MMSADDRARILQRALDGWPSIEAASRVDTPQPTFPYRLLELGFGCGYDYLGYTEASVTVDVQTGRIIAAMAKAIIEGELRELRGLPNAPAKRIQAVAGALADAADWLRSGAPGTVTPIAQLRALAASGKLDRWHVSGDHAAEISAALRLIPQVIEQLDAALAELRKVG